MRKVSTRPALMTAFCSLVVLLVVLLNPVGAAPQQPKSAIPQEKGNTSALAANSKAQNGPAGDLGSVTLSSVRHNLPDYVIPGRVIVKLKAGLPALSGDDSAGFLETGLPSLDEKIKRHRISKVRSLLKPHLSGCGQANGAARNGNRLKSCEWEQFYELQLPVNMDIGAVLEDLAADPNVLYAEPDCSVKAFQAPNDPEFVNQWALVNIQAESAWNLGTGSASTIVAVVDSGIDSGHLELAGRVLPGYDFVDGDVDASDPIGHGTHIAGIIGARANNGTGIAGLNWDVRLLPVRVLESIATGSTSRLTQGIYWAVDNGAQIINLSIGTLANLAYLKAAVDYAHANGCLVVAAMGNEGNDTVYYPAAYPNVLAVGATNSSDARVSSSWGSNYGSHLDVVAPGDNIISTVPINGYQLRDGTSFATAHVSGIGALILSADPTLSPDAVKNIIEQSADDLVGDSAEDTEGWDRYYGMGRINAFKALGIAVPPVTTYRLSLTVVSDTVDKGGGSVNGDGNISCTGQGSSVLGMSGMCQANFPAGTTVNLYQTPDADSRWAPWSATACGTDQNCRITMSGDQNLTVTFPYSSMAKTNSTGQGFESLTLAYGNAAQVDTIYGRAVTFTEDFTLGGSKAVKLLGGRDVWYQPQNAWTTLKGVLKVQGGSLTVDRLRLAIE